MKNNIMTLIESGYADLRKSEKQAADYILDHMDQVPEMPLDRLAKAAKVSQPTVLRMLKALGYDGYKDFRYQLVAELAKAGSGSETGGSLSHISSLLSLISVSYLGAQSRVITGITMGLLRVVLKR